MGFNDETKTPFQKLRGHFGHQEMQEFNLIYCMNYHNETSSCPGTKQNNAKQWPLSSSVAKSCKFCSPLVRVSPSYFEPGKFWNQFQSMWGKGNKSKRGTEWQKDRWVVHNIDFDIVDPVDHNGPARLRNEKLYDTLYRSVMVLLPSVSRQPLASDLGFCMCVVIRVM